MGILSITFRALISAIGIGLSMWVGMWDHVSLFDVLIALNFVALVWGTGEDGPLPLFVGLEGEDGGGFGGCDGGGF